MPTIVHTTCRPFFGIALDSQQSVDSDGSNVSPSTAISESTDGANEAEDDGFADNSNERRKEVRKYLKEAKSSKLVSRLSKERMEKQVMNCCHFPSPEAVANSCMQMRVFVGYG